MRTPPAWTPHSLAGPFAHSSALPLPSLRTEYIEEMRQREKDLGILPDPVIDAFLRGQALEGHRHSVTTDLMLRVLGLEVGFRAWRKACISHSGCWA